jgi:phosphoenolpyruvate---glycerone phosphotransferase subunit DhaK
VLNFDMGAELAQEEGVQVETVLIWDDVASAPPDRKSDRRGIAGLVPIVKLAGAAAASVTSLGELKRIAEKARDNTRSVGVSMTPGSIPATGKPTFEIDEDKIGLGMGIHGEKGVGLIPMQTANDLVPQLLEIIFGDDLAFEPGCEVILLINSLGATTMMELLIVLKKVKQELSQKGIKVYDTMVGPYVTCQEMSGCSISLTKLDDELKRYWDVPCSSVCYTKM